MWRNALPGLSGLAARFCVPALLMCTAASVACTSGAETQVPADAARSVMSLRGLDCSSCGEEAAFALAELPGVYAAHFDMVGVEVQVAFDPRAIDEAALLQALEQRAQREGFSVVQGPGHGDYLAVASFDAALDVKQISKAGEYVELLVNLAPGKVTVFDFHAQWCGPCREVDAHMHKLLQTRDDVGLRRLDVVDWDSEVAKAYLKNIPTLPYIEVWDAYGKRVARISGLDLAKLDGAIEKAAARSK